MGRQELVQTDSYRIEPLRFLVEQLSVLRPGEYCFHYIYYWAISTVLDSLITTTRI